MTMRWGAVFLLAVITGIGCNSHHSGQEESPYVGQEDRSIKSLSDQEVQGYQNGEGMGLSKVAELNDYPGPKHVLELSEQLSLSGDQISQTQALYDEMKSEAKDWGDVTLPLKKSSTKYLKKQKLIPER